MSGIVGFINHGLIKNEDNKKVIKEMADKVSHRGPDDEGYYIDDTISLGFKRLATIDLEKGKYPIQNEDNTKILAFDGIIYNHIALRDDLISKGHVFSTKTDSESLLHGYEEYGISFLDKIRGEFAFVIWDSSKKKIICARDIFGAKPFYFYENGNDFMFASEIKAFLPNPNFKKEFDEKHLPVYLSFEYIPTHETFFKNVYKLLPGHYLEYQDGKAEIISYNKFEFKPDKSKTLDEYIDLIDKTFQESVKIHHTSDVPIGGFLSSGIDSSYVHFESLKHNQVKSFSIGYEEEQYSELSYSTEFAKNLNFENTPIKINAQDYFGITPKAQYYMDEPLSNPSAIPLYFLSENASKEFKLILSGEGADELFGGYNQYKEALIYEKYQKLPAGFRGALAAVAKRMPKIKGRRFLIRGAMPLDKRYFRIDYVFNFSEREKVLKNKNLNLECAPITKKFFDESSNLDQLSQMQYFDFHTWQVYDILLKADRMTMANSVELRAPFMDKEILKIALTLPTEYKVNRENTKIALRKAAIRKLPSKTANKKKLGFPSPLAAWMKEDKYCNMIREKFTSKVANQYFETSELLSILEEHRKGNEANMQKIWTIYCFIVWYEQYFTGEKSEQTF